MNLAYINKIRSIHSNPAVTIYMNTNRTFPDNSQDSISLKNMISEVETRLKNESKINESNLILKKLKEFASEINHNYNLDSLIIFVSHDFFEFIRLPVKVTDNVIIGGKFSIKILIRSLLQTEDYYVLCLSRKTIRIIEAVNEFAVTEIEDGVFPLNNDSYLETDDIRKAWASTKDNYAKEFFIKADKLFNGYYNRNPKPVVLAGDIRNISYFKEITDSKNIIIGEIEGNFDDSKPHEVVENAFSVVSKFVLDGQKKAMEELNIAKKEQKLLVDISDIYTAAKEGRGFKLFVEKNYSQPAKIENEKIVLKDNPAGSDVIDDIINEIIDLVIKAKGIVMFMEVNQLSGYNKIALIKRY
jgi:hypothetical protein